MSIHLIHWLQYIQYKIDWYEFIITPMVKINNVIAYTGRRFNVEREYIQ